MSAPSRRTRTGGVDRMKGRVFRLAVDAHVHLRDPHQADLAAIAERLRLCAGEPIDGGVLLLAEIGNAGQFNRLRTLPGVHLLPEVNAISARTPHLNLVVIAGRQVTTAEGIEVLIHNTTLAPPDGECAREVLAWARRHRRVATLPWGLGQWTGARRRVVGELLELYPGLAVGDVPMRPVVWAERLVRRAEDGRPVLRGTDTLTTEGDARRIGSWGQVVDVRVSGRGPAADVLCALQQPRLSRPFGQRLGLMAVLRLQGRLRIETRR